jgi:hypothetical protein
MENKLPNIEYKPLDNIKYDSRFENVDNFAISNNNENENENFAYEYGLVDYKHSLVNGTLEERLSKIDPRFAKFQNNEIEETHERKKCTCSLQ